MALRDQVVPPTLILVNPDDAATGLDLVALKPWKMAITHVLSNGFGFGGRSWYRRSGVAQTTEKVRKGSKKD